MTVTFWYDAEQVENNLTSAEMNICRRRTLDMANGTATKLILAFINSSRKAIAERLSDERLDKSIRDAQIDVDVPPHNNDSYSTRINTANKNISNPKDNKAILQEIN